MSRLLLIIAVLIVQVAPFGYAQSYKKPTAQIELPNYNPQHSISDVVFSPDGRFAVIYTQHPNISIYVYDLGQKVITTIFAVHKMNVWDVDVSQDGKSVVSVDIDEVIKIWDPYTGDELNEIRHSGSNHPDYNASECKFFPSGKKILASFMVSDLGPIDSLSSTYVFDATDGSIIQEIKNRALGPIVAFMPDENQVLLASGNVYDLTQQNVIKRFPLLGMGCKISQDLTKVFTLNEFRFDNDRYLCEWDFNTGSLVNKIPIKSGVDAGVNFVLSPHAGYLAVKYTPGVYEYKPKKNVKIISFKEKKDKWLISKDDLSIKEEEGVDLIKFSPDETKAIVTVGAKAFLFEFEE